ncbi:acylneuraminate cytidylyltransferase family protein [Cohaesibacter celericrescens]|uniref:acylneuraminate cytidylyltransferase family protein n=1 Tax=Cohaesibacter celericrescens TaxID=2067669 RepID=UPI00356589E9
MKILAIIPARSGSKRIVNKNIKLFSDDALICWSLRFAQAISDFSNIIVSTDSDTIASVAKTEGVDVPWLRPATLSGDTATSIDVVLHALEVEEKEGRHYDYVALLQPTSPIRHKSRWIEALAMIEQSHLDAVIGVSPARHHPYHCFTQNSDLRLSPFIDTDVRKMRTQDLPPAFAVAGNLYLSRVQSVKDHYTFFPEKTGGVICSHPLEMIDLDTAHDWTVGEALAKHYGVGCGNSTFEL